MKELKKKVEAELKSEFSYVIKTVYNKETLYIDLFEGKHGDDYEEHDTSKANEEKYKKVALLLREEEKELCNKAFENYKEKDDIKDYLERVYNFGYLLRLNDNTEDTVAQIKMLDIFCKEKNDGKYSNFHALVQAHKNYFGCN